MEKYIYLAYMGVDYEGIDEDTIGIFYSEESALEHLDSLKNKCDPQGDSDKYFEVKKFKIND